MNKKLTRQDLEKWAESLDADKAPYTSKIHAENAFFVSQLESRPGEELDEIRTMAEKDYSHKQEESKKWKHLSWGSLAAGIGANIVTGGTVGLVALVGGFAGMMYSGSRSSKEEIMGHEGAHFVTQLDDVAHALSIDEEGGSQRAEGSQQSEGSQQAEGSKPVEGTQQGEGSQSTDSSQQAE